MGEQNKKRENYVKMAMSFLEDMHSVKGLGVIIDIFDEIRYSGLDKKEVNQKILRILHNLIDSDSLDSLLEKEDKKVLSLFLKDFLKLNCQSGNYYLANEEFAELTLDEFYNVLIEIKYSKEKDLINKNKLPING
ncbi:hypothetical protein [Clostridium sp. Cult2]|uniref:hypothetical protein n=1 Tax=Clostridium sp. Cult2 TaxID=2079003 RepID=UPI001F366CAE|nr:hypothetical protein [Clostridium sp. Cult2]MCF6464636.1 hypothetical protein [Clostridium sp. Cult2]